MIFFPDYLKYDAQIMPKSHPGTTSPLYRAKMSKLTNFTRAIHAESPCFRPETDAQLHAISRDLVTTPLLPRGAGLSYSDGCLNRSNPIIDCRRLNHLISFDPETGILVCQPGTTFLDLLSIHPEFIPPVMPGTLHATLAGGIANDVHGKNNPHEGTLGQHIEWIELQIGEQCIHCSRTEHPELFIATIGGLGLTGIIRRLAIRLKAASHSVEVKTTRYTQWAALLDCLQKNHLQYDYQVAWLDCLNANEKAILSQANHSKTSKSLPSNRQLTIPNLPVQCISRWSMARFNQLYFYLNQNKQHQTTLIDFNNPLDRINHWNRLYGKKGLIQFQAVFETSSAEKTLQTLMNIIRQCQATPTLAVLKYLTQHGAGLLSFIQPGFTLAIDFNYNPQSLKAIQILNETITQMGGKIYLAKDLLLTREQFEHQYANFNQFNEIVARYQSPFQSDLSRRIGLAI